MITLQNTAVAVLMIAWIAYGTVFAVQAIRIRKRRRLNPETESQPKWAPAANIGLFLQSAGLYFAFRRDAQAEGAPALAILGGIALAPLSLALGWLAIRELGVQWRIQAVVTRSHQLITTGPYRFVRHPVYTSLFGMLLATALTLSEWKKTLAAIVLYVAGTEIRIAAEERLLCQQFGEEFTNYRGRVKGYIPFLR